MRALLALSAIVVCSLQGAHGFQHAAGLRLHTAQSQGHVCRPLRRASPPLSVRRHTLHMSASADGAISKLDVGAMSKWTGATVLQFGLISATLIGFDKIMALLTPAQVLGWGPKVFTIFFFAFMAIRSRVFSVLDNSRPTPPKMDSDWKDVEVGQAKNKFMEQVQRPSWMPPPKAFPVIWSTIGLLRCISSVLVWEAVGRRFFELPILALMAHLCVGDTWNTINNVEKRKGTAAAVVLLVLGSAFNAIYQYYQVLPKAGYVLAPSGLWLSIATVLVWTIWRINPDASGKVEPMLPYKK